MFDNKTIVSDGAHSLPLNQNDDRGISLGGHTVVPEIFASSALRSAEASDRDFQTYFGPYASPSLITEQPGDLWSTEDLISSYRYACGASAQIAKRDILTSNNDGKTDSYFPPKIDAPITVPRRAQSLAEWKEQLLNYGKLDDGRKMDAVEKAIGLTQHALSPSIGSRASAKTQESRLLDFGPRDMVLPLLELCRGAPDLPVSLSPVPPGLGYGRVPSEMSQAPADVIGIAGVEMAARVTLLVQEFSLLLLTHQYDDAQAICARLESELATCSVLLRRGQDALHDFNHSKIIGGLGASVHE